MSATHVRLYCTCEGEYSQTELIEAACRPTIGLREGVWTYFGVDLSAALDLDRCPSLARPRPILKTVSKLKSKVICVRTVCRLRECEY